MITCTRGIEISCLLYNKKHITLFTVACHYPLLLSISAGHILTSHTFKFTLILSSHRQTFLPSGFLALVIPANYLWTYYLCHACQIVSPSSPRNNSVFKTHRHWVMVSLYFRRKIMFISLRGRILFDVWPSEIENDTSCRNVCNHVPTKVISYNRKKFSLFIPL